MALKFEFDKKKRTAVVCGVEDKFCEQIVIPSTVEYYRKKYDVVAIEAHAFKECKKLKSVTIPDSVTKIERYAFWDCSSLTSVTIPDSVTEIGRCAFYGCSSLKEFKGKFAADNGRCLIKDGALIAYASASGTTYAIPNSVTEIGRCAFLGCNGLTSITIPDSVTEIRWSAFEGCSNLTSVTIPDSVTEIGGRAFDGCSSLTSVTIPDSVTAIGDWAFIGCRSLTSVTIPNSVIEIERAAFSGCSSLKEFKGKYAADNGRCLIKDGELIAYARASGEVYAIPNGVTKIGKYAFGGCSNLTSVTIPNSVTEIGVSAFNNCKSLTSITIPDSVTEIGGCAFRYCSSLTSVTIPNSVTDIGHCAFECCSSLKNVEICNEEGSVKIDSFAFGPDVKVAYLGKDAQPKPKQEVKEQPAPEVATPAPTIDLDKLIDAAAADGVITDKERSVILKKAVTAGYDADEVEILIDGKIAEKQRETQPKKKGLFARLFGKK